MTKALPYSFFVNYTSAKLKVAGAIDRLNAILITRANEILPTFLELYNPGDAVANYGIDSKEKAYADSFFAFQNKNGVFPDILNIYNYYPEAQPAVLKGGRILDIEDLKKTGSFSINLGGGYKQVAVDLTSMVSLTDIAQAIQNAINNVASSNRYTSLDIEKANDSTLQVAKVNEDGASTQTLAINTNAAAFTLTNSDPTVVTLAKDPANDKQANLEALKEGEALVKVIAKADGANRAVCEVRVLVNEVEGVLAITTEIAPAEITEAILSISTEANDYSYSIDNKGTIAFDKDTKTITGLAVGSAVLKLKAKAADAKETVREVEVIVRDNLALVYDIIPFSPPENMDAYRLAKFVYDQITGGFELQSGIAGVDSRIDFMKSGATDTDLAPILKMRDKDGAVALQGRAAESFGQAVENIVSSNGNFYSIGTLFALTEDEIHILGNACAASRGRYLGVVSMHDRRLLGLASPLEKFAGYDGLLANYNPTDEVSLTPLTQAFVASLDLSKANSVVSFNFVPATSYDSIGTLSKPAEMQRLAKNRINAIYAVGDFGLRNIYYGEGKIFGDMFKSANTYIWNSYVKFNMEKTLFFALANNQIVGARDPQDIRQLLDLGVNTCEGFVRSGIMVTNAILRPNEEVALKKLLNGSEDDYNSCRSNGYVFQFVKNSVDDATNLITSEFRLVYIVNVATDRIAISSVIV